MIPQQGWKVIFEIKNRMSGVGVIKDVREFRSGDKVSVWVEMDKDFVKTLVDNPTPDVYWRRIGPPKPSEPTSSNQLYAA